MQLINMDQSQISAPKNEKVVPQDNGIANDTHNGNKEQLKHIAQNSNHTKRPNESADISVSPGPNKKQHVIKYEDGQAPSSNTSTPSDSDGRAHRSSHPLSSTGHRPVTSCTHCRQHKIKCNASDNFPNPCSRCERMGLHCEIDPQFRPKKGSQLQNLRRDVDELKLKIEYLTRNESLIARAFQQGEVGQELVNAIKSIDMGKLNEMKTFEELEPQKLQQRVLRKSYTSQEQSTENKPAKISVQTYLASEPHLLQDIQKSNVTTPQDINSDKSDSSNKYSLPALLNDSAPTNNHKESLPPVLQMALHRNTSVTNSPKDTPGSSHDSPSNSSITSAHITRNRMDDPTHRNDSYEKKPQKKSPIVMTTNAIPLLPSPYASIDEFVLGDVRISIDKASRLHHIFVTKYLPYFPILSSESATELYSQSQLLFWTVMLTSCLSDPEPSMYIKLSSLIKQLAIETCWIRTPRSTHISQALLILCNWPLPNQKVLDDCSYRFVGLAKSLSYQLGLHRGEFISEFTRTQTSMPNAEKWRTRTWLGIFFSELCWASILGLPPTAQTDHLIENARMSLDEEEETTFNDEKRENLDKEGTPGSNNKEHTFNAEVKSKSTKSKDNDKLSGSPSPQKEYRLPPRFRRLICLASFQAKLCKVMGSSVASPDGLMEPRDRASSLAILERELDFSNRKLHFEKDAAVHIYYLYVKLMICCFAFLPDTPTEDQSQYVTEAYLCATKIVSLLTSLLETQQLIELPIYVRHSATFAALILFKLQLTPLLLNKYLDSARQSIVTIHRLYRNQLSAWATAVENDISRTASVLEKLNFVLITHPTVFVEEEGIICRMRSHLTDSLFYDLVWCIHEARRREMDPKYNQEALEKAEAKRKQRGRYYPSGSLDRKLLPLPFYNQISKEDFETIVQTTPGGTAVTTLVPTKSALSHAKKLAETNQGPDGAIIEINGIPLSMLDETGSVSLPSVENLEVMRKSGGKPPDQVTSHKSRTPSESSKRYGSATINFAEAAKQRPTSALSNRSKSHANGVTNNYSLDKHAESLAAQPLFIGDTSMQRSNSTPAATPIQLSSYAQGRRKTGSRDHPNSLFMMNNSLSSNLSLNKSFPLPLEAGSSKEQPAGTARVRSPMVRESVSNSYSNLNLFLSNNGLQPMTAAEGQNDSTKAFNQSSDLNSFFQQQSTGWIEGSSINDDFLGWFDMNMEPEF